jgi:hypothetical protein
MIEVQLKKERKACLRANPPFYLDGYNIRIKLNANVTPGVPQIENFQTQGNG